MATSLMDTRATLSKRRAVESQDFLAVIFVGSGENLYPFNQGTNVVSKALLPVGNVPILNTVLDWVFQSGLTDVLIISPPSTHTAISNHLQENYSSGSHPRARIELKRYTDGEKDDDDDASASAGGGAGGYGAYGYAEEAGDKVGTARLLRRFRAFIKSDFVLLPCDLAAPSSLPLASILDKHRTSPDAVLTAVFYEPVEAVKDGAEKILVGTDRATDELLLVKDVEGMEDDLELRMELVRTHPSLSLTTRLLDAHIYVFRRTVLDLLAQRRPRDLDSVREQVVPWLVKGAWQEGLGQKWAPILNPPKRDPLAAALAASTSARPGWSDLLAGPGSPASQHTPARRSDSASSSSSASTSAASAPSAGDELVKFKAGLVPEPLRRRRREPAGWTCKVIVVKPEPVAAPEPAKDKGGKAAPEKAAEPDHLIRANSLAGYWELNRRALRLAAQGLAGASAAPQPGTPGVAPGGGAQDELAPPLISASAQISPDSLLGEGTRVGERASIKKCVVGRHCVIGRGAKITGCVLWDFVVVEENARIENSILCANVRVGDRAQIKDCEFGTGFEALAGASLKGERLVAGQEA
ncbi:Translation initiation factor eIF-2B subunit gamma [Cryptotrichosporon argae]